MAAERVNTDLKLPLFLQCLDVYFLQFEGNKMFHQIGSFVESIGAMLRSFSLPALPVSGFPKMILLFGSMKLDHPPASLIMGLTNSLFNKLGQ